MPSPVVAGLALVALAPVLLGQGLCPPSGLLLTTTGGRLGDPFSLGLSGTPLVSGLLAFDVAGGPVGTPIGTLCIGLTPATQLLPFALPASGTFSISGTAPTTTDSSPWRSMRTPSGPRVTTHVPTRERISSRSHPVFWVMRLASYLLENRMSAPSMRGRIRSPSPNASCCEGSARNR